MSESPNFGSADRADAGAALEEAKAFNKGKGGLLAVMLGLLAAALGGFAFYLIQDQPNPYAELGKQVNGLRSTEFDGFWNCALPGTKPADIKNNEALSDELHNRGAAGARYATHLQSKCSPPLRELSTRLRALLPPDEAAPLLKAMADAATKIDVGVGAYAGHLQNLDGPYDRDAASAEVEGMARGWYDFRTAHAQLNKLVKAKLGR